MAKTDPIDPAVPAGSEDPKLGDNRIRELARAVAEILNKDHYIGTDGGSGTGYNEDDAGEHSKVTLRATTKPTAVASKGFVYGKDVSGKIELFYEDEDGSEIQITTGGILNSCNLVGDQTVAGVKTLSSQLVLPEGLTAAKAIVSTLADGTAPMTVVSATKVANLNADLFDGKHVDAQYGAWASKSNNTSYLAASDGFVCAYATGTGAIGMTGLTDASNPPTTARARNSSTRLEEGGVGITMPVKKGDYWKVTGATTVSWLPLGT